MQYEKKLLAAAVAGAFAAVPMVVSAQTSTVQIGGSANLNYYINNPNNDNKAFKGDTIEGSEPELYVQGEENLGGGLSYWFRCATSMDYIGASGVGLCTRNSAVGVKGSWGNVFAGNWDTPVKIGLNTIKGFFSGSNALYGGSANILYGGTGAKTNPVQSVTGSQSTTGATQLSTSVSNSPQSYYRRHSNLVSYHSPSWSGFSFKAAYSTGNEHTGLGGTNLKPRLYSLNGDYANGPAFVSLGFERHVDYNPGNATYATTGVSGTYNGGDDDKWTIGGGYTFANSFRLAGLYTETKYETQVGRELKVSGWAVYADWNIQGPHSVKAQYGKLNDIKGNSLVNVGSYKGSAQTNCGIAGNVSCASDTGATIYTLAYMYRLSKRTAVGFAYNHLSNDSNGAISMGKVAATIGGNQSTYGMFTQHRF